jgi:hypothetical protein
LAMSYGRGLVSNVTKTKVLCTCAAQVVVDSAATGKALLAPGIMERRTTLCPLDKVH